MFLSSGVILVLDHEEELVKKGGLHPHNKFTCITCTILICAVTDRSLKTVDSISQLPDGEMFQIKSQTNVHTIFGLPITCQT